MSKPFSVLEGMTPNVVYQMGYRDGYLDGCDEAVYKSGYRDGIVAGEVDRAAIIEECALVAESYDETEKLSLIASGEPLQRFIATAIRALKGRP